MKSKDGIDMRDVVNTPEWKEYIQREFDVHVLRKMAESPLAKEDPKIKQSLLDCAQDIENELTRSTGNS